MCYIRQKDTRYLSKINYIIKDNYYGKETRICIFRYGPDSKVSYKNSPKNSWTGEVTLTSFIYGNGYKTYVMDKEDEVFSSKERSWKPI